MFCTKAMGSYLYLLKFSRNVDAVRIRPDGDLLLLLRAVAAAVLAGARDRRWCAPAARLRQGWRDEAQRRGCSVRVRPVPEEACSSPQAGLPKAHPDKVLNKN